MATEQRLIDLGAMFPKESLEEQIRRIINAPTVDAVPVVRCKDCYWWNKERAGLNGECVCNQFSQYKFFENFTLPDDFCSRGERRTDNG